MEGLTPAEYQRLAELDLAEMASVIDDLCDAIAEVRDEEYLIRVASLAKAIKAKAHPVSHATFAAVAIEMLTAERSRKGS